MGVEEAIFCVFHPEVCNVSDLLSACDENAINVVLSLELDALHEMPCFLQLCGGANKDSGFPISFHPMVIPEVRMLSLGHLQESEMSHHVQIGQAVSVPNHSKPCR